MGAGRPTILFREKSAAIDVRGFSIDPPEDVRNVRMDINLHFSDIKDQFIAEWNTNDPKATRQAIKEQIEKTLGRK